MANESRAHGRERALHRPKAMHVITIYTFLAKLLGLILVISFSVQPVKIVNTFSFCYGTLKLHYSKVKRLSDFISRPGGRARQKCTGHAGMATLERL